MIIYWKAGFAVKSLKLLIKTQKRFYSILFS